MNKIYWYNLRIALFFIFSLLLRVYQRLCDDDREVYDYAISLKGKGLIDDCYVDDIKGCVKIRMNRRTIAILNIKELEDLMNDHVEENPQEEDANAGNDMWNMNICRKC